MSSPQSLRKNYFFILEMGPFLLETQLCLFRPFVCNSAEKGSVFHTFPIKNGMISRFLLIIPQRPVRESNPHLVLRSKALGIFLWDYLCFILSLKIPDLRAFLALVGTSLSAFILSLKAPVSGINVGILLA